MVTAHGTVRDGLVVGLIGYAAVALFYSGFDVLAARDPLYTVDLLGKAVFRGLRDPGVLFFPLPLDGMAIFLYNALHLAIALVIGVIVTALAGEAERHPERSLLVLFTLIAGFVVTVTIVGLLTAPMRPVLPWWSIVVANALAVIVAGSYLVRQRPRLWHRLTLVAG
jgi:F0F1-type ATP synthase membrane subunit c/vacuolar-type H+-ATPase subunit K